MPNFCGTTAFFRRRFYLFISVTCWQVIPISSEPETGVLLHFKLVGDGFVCCVLFFSGFSRFSRMDRATSPGNYSNHGKVGVVGHDIADDQDYSILWQTGVAFVLTVFILIAVAGNILVCVAIYTDRHLRHIGNTFTASLALADLLVGLVVMPLALVNDLLGYWSLPQLLCGIWVSFDIMGSTASILNLCAISLDRYIHIKDPLHYNATVTTKVVIVAVLLVWILSTLISFVPLNLGWHRIHHQPSAGDGTGHGVNFSTDHHSLDSTGKTAFINPDEPLFSRHHAAVSSSPTSSSTNGQSVNSTTVVTEEQCTLEINPTYAATSSIISFYFPCCVMLIIYTRLYMEARRHVKCLKETIPCYYQAVATSTATATTLSLPRSNGNHHHLTPNHGGSRPSLHDFPSGSAHSNMVSEHKAAVTLGIIVSVFLICWAPFFAINIIHANCRCISNVTFKALTWLGYCNSSFNPIIYSIFNHDFRKAFRKLLHFQVCFAYSGSGGSPRNSRDRAFSTSAASSGLPRTPNLTRASVSCKINGQDAAL